MQEYILKIGLNERTDVHAARMVDRVGGWVGGCGRPILPGYGGGRIFGILYDARASF